VFCFGAAHGHHFCTATNDVYSAVLMPAQSHIKTIPVWVTLLCAAGKCGFNCKFFSSAPHQDLLLMPPTSHLMVINGCIPGVWSSWACEANHFSPSQEIPHILWNLKVHYHINKCPLCLQLVPWLSMDGQMDIWIASCLTHWGRVTQICVFTLQLCKTDDANLRF
jgi:hypothetical protein